MILFIASEVMFFVAWFWTFFEIGAVPRLQRTHLPSMKCARPWRDLAAEGRRDPRPVAPAR
jgi:heme/copper-type cytochrome/quinol oxidase subunit 3